MQDLVHGCIQIVPLPGDGIVICDEEFLFKAYQYNPKASKVCAGHVIMDGGMHGDILFCAARSVK